MEQQLAMTQRLIDLQVRQRQMAHLEAAPVVTNKPVSRTLVKDSPKLAQALVWLTAYPDCQGLSLRKAAEAAGVSVSAMRRALAERKADETRQNRLF